MKRGLRRMRGRPVENQSINLYGLNEDEIFEETGVLQTDSSLGMMLEDEKEGDRGENRD